MIGIHLWRLSTVIGLGVGMAGCYNHIDEFTSLCKEPAVLNGWNQSDRMDLNYVYKGVPYLFNVTDTRSPRRPLGPLRHVFWVELTGFTFGSPPGTMIYDPGEAILVIGGNEVGAMRRAWASDIVNGYPAATAEVNVPLDLHAKSTGVVPSFFIAFPINPPNAKVTYIFRPGTILLDDKKVSLPIYKSCFTPARTWKARIPVG